VSSLLAVGDAPHNVDRPVSPTLDLTPEWRAYFLRALQPSSKFSAPRDFLQRDILQTMRRLIPEDAKILEAGVGSGALLAGLRNEVRDGIDCLPEAVEMARGRDRQLRITLADALTFRSSERYDAIICDRLCHTVTDIQGLLQNLAAHLSPRGRIFLTCFNFLWQVPLGVAARMGVVDRPPEPNWLSESDFTNLFSLAHLEEVRHENRVILPAPIPVVAGLLNRFVAPLPAVKAASLYRVYVLRHGPRPNPVPKVTVVVPTRNEAGNIERAVRDTPVMGSGTELVFVEGGSTDQTYERIEEVIASYRGPLELRLFKQPGKGKGDAVRHGFAEGTGDLFMILDADLTVLPQELPKFYEAMLRGLGDYVQGTRLVYPMEDDAMRFLNKLGNIFFAKTFSFLLSQPIKDTLCGTKVLWRRDYERIARGRAVLGDFDPFGDFDLLLGASRLNLKLVELPIRYKNRTYGNTNIQRFRHGLLLLRMSMLAARKLKFV
jgi:SAM-dependent methyltransferase